MGLPAPCLTQTVPFPFNATLLVYASMKPSEESQKRHDALGCAPESPATASANDTHAANRYIVLARLVPILFHLIGFPRGKL
jgi:hypothetical protein